MKVYLAGPMRGYAQHNFPAFDKARDGLVAMGHDVASPADHDREIGFDENTVDVPAELLFTMMRWDLERVQLADAVCFLPGWQKSKGALCERTVAFYLGVPCFDISYDAEDRMVLTIQPRLAEPVISFEELPPLPVLEEREDVLPIADAETTSNAA